MIRRFARLALILPVALLAACTSATAPRYLLVAPDNATTQTRVAARTVEIRRVSLPAYAAAPGILTTGPDGALIATPGQWADDPERGITATLASAVEARSTASVAVEPWPLSERPEARVEIRLDELVAKADGRFSLSGQIAVSSPDGQVRDRLRRVALEVPITGSGPQAIATAQAAALAALAGEIVAALR